MRYLTLAVVLATPAIAATCESLSGVALPNTTIATAQTVAAAPPVPAYCRVTGVLKPSPDSNIQFEVWMPSSGWNGKFQGMGNGGFAGSLDTRVLAVAVSHGYAAAATDTGHRAGGTDANWALDHPQKVIDFGYRAIHETAEKAKALIAAFYGSGPQRSYFASCSNGGRQALMEAQRYPADYDGIVAGAPANYWTHLLANAVWDVQAIADAAAFIPPAKLPAIGAAVIAACDSLDGVRDGVIDDPRQCHFDPSKLLCAGPESDSCLTAPQLAALQKIYSGARTSKGQPIFPGYALGGEAGEWSPWIIGPAPGKSIGYAFGTQFFANMVFEKAAWDYRTFDIDRDVKPADDKLARVLNATDPDLKPFQARGGKLIIYHGWNDAAISPLNAIDYYQSVVKKMGAKNADAFLRLYMVPGMQHCGGGPGPNSFTETMEQAIEGWVEQNAPPARIIATKYKTNANPASGVARTRPLCPYPQVARWNGTGSTDDAASFACVAR